MFKFEDGVHSHMPFAAPDPKNGFAPREFCCLAVNGKWKIHQFANGVWSRIPTGLPEDATECSPAAECIGGTWRMTFVAGGAETDRLFRLYHICDLDGGAPPVVLRPADVGFLQKNTLVHATRHGPLFIVKPQRTLKVSFRDAKYLYRVTYDPFCPKRLFVSGQTVSGEIFSRIYLTGNNELYGLEADGVPAYKAFFWHDRCFHAERIGAGFEDRRIAEAEHVRITRLDEGELVCVEAEPAGRPAQDTDEEFE